jgi:glycosyltransferase involved in cell wall biosynthesis
MKMTIIICTKDRPKEIQDILNTIRIQKRMPERIIIVDGSDTPVDKEVGQFTDLPIDYTTCRPPSLPKQRNIGISMVNDDCDYVGFLDDDLLLNEDTFLEIENLVLAKDSQLGGVGITNSSAPRIKNNFLRKLFFLDNYKGGVFTPSGCASAFRNRSENQKVQWLSGGVSFWKKQVLDEFKFDEWFDGIGYLEDVDFSYRVSRKYPLYLAGKATCTHESHPIAPHKLYQYGIWQLTSWWYFVNKTKDFPKLVVLWSMLGLLINNAAMGLLKPHTSRLKSALGNLKGFLLIFSGKALTQRTFYKQ